MTGASVAVASLARNVNHSTAPGWPGWLAGNGANPAVPVLVQVGLDPGLPAPAPPRVAAWGTSPNIGAALC